MRAKSWMGKGGLSFALGAACAVGWGCGGPVDEKDARGGANDVAPGEDTGEGAKPMREEADRSVDEAETRYAEARLRMVREQMRGRGIRDKRVLIAMERVPRHRFTQPGFAAMAYADSPLPIGSDQTISQPYIVALMTELARVDPEDRALDVGTGSGYQAAVLGELCEQVHGIEIVPELCESARRRLKEQGYGNVEIRCGDGYRGWPEHAPFDVIILAAAPDHVPQPLVDQLAVGGRLVLPVGGFSQDLIVIEKQEDGSIRKENVAPVRFVPMTGEAKKR